MNERAQARGAMPFLAKIATAEACRFLARAPVANTPSRRDPATDRFIVNQIAQQNNRVAFVLEPLRRDVFRFFDEADHGDRRRRIDRAGRALVVEADIAAGDRRVESAAGLRQAADGLRAIARKFPGYAGCRSSDCRWRQAEPRRCTPDCARLRRRQFCRLRTDRDKHRRRCNRPSWR